MGTLVRLDPLRRGWRTCAGWGSPPWHTLVGALVAGVVLGCSSKQRIGMVATLDPEEVDVYSGDPARYVASLVTSAKAGPRSTISVHVGMFDLELVDPTSGAGIFSSSAVFTATITVLRADGAEGESYTESWPLRDLVGEVDSGGTYRADFAPRVASIDLNEWSGQLHQVDLSIVLETTSRTPVRVRWTPSAYELYFTNGCNYEGNVESMTLELRSW